MRKLSNTQIKTRDQIAASLDTVGEEIRHIIAKVNEVMEEAQEQIELKTGRYNELIQDANAFIQSVHEEQEAFFEGKSDTWRDGDAGQGYEYWKDQWACEVDEIDEVELPEDIEEPDLDAAEVLRELAEQP